MPNRKHFVVETLPPAFRAYAARVISTGNCSGKITLDFVDNFIRLCKIDCSMVGIELPVLIVET